MTEDGVFRIAKSRVLMCLVHHTAAEPVVLAKLFNDELEGGGKHLEIFSVNLRMVLNDGLPPERLFSSTCVGQPFKDPGHPTRLDSRPLSAESLIRP